MKFDMVLKRFKLKIQQLVRVAMEWGETSARMNASASKLAEQGRLLLA